ncbi:hypothetical protein NLI96_g3457 [Meripilus lineatus]|uniref:Uncharacterized protein n=1 Tax=Meripilus lineatus TaxID=2056292 RepID=A0AAD5YGK6_9APHY|nr:hypothetical protein NLI96_g3457 [Physisporinus lineatus]
MLPAFILTRTFAISALFVGVSPLAYAAPVAFKRSPLSGGCVYYGCLIAGQPVSSISAASPSESPQPEFIPKFIEIIEHISSAPSINVHNSEVDLAEGSVIGPPSTTSAIVKVVDVDISNEDSSVISVRI